MPCAVENRCCTAIPVFTHHVYSRHVARSRRIKVRSKIRTWVGSCENHAVLFRAKCFIRQVPKLFRWIPVQKTPCHAPTMSAVNLGLIVQALPPSVIWEMLLRHTGCTLSVLQVRTAAVLLHVQTCACMSYYRRFCPELPVGR